MKANVENLKKALALSAKAHKVEFCDWSDEGQLAVKSEEVPVVNDFKMICDAFYGRGNYDYDVEWGYTNVYIHDDFLNEVQEFTLNLALPNGWVHKMAV